MNEEDGMSEKYRTPDEAIQAIRDKLDRGEEPSAEEREFLEQEGVKLDVEEGEGRPLA